MELTLANPVGLLSLLSIPTVLIIHFIQQRPRQVVISTLFMIRSGGSTETRTRTLSRLENSLPLWIQLLIALLISLLISQPRLASPIEIQRLVFVVDDSPSMFAFYSEIEKAIEGKLAENSRRSSTAEVVVIPASDPNYYIYRGTMPAEALRAVSKWKPNGVSVDLLATTSEIERLVRNAHRYYLITDRETSRADSFSLIAIGEPFDNWGFTGLHLKTAGDELTFEATVKSFATKEATRSWSVHTEHGKGDSFPISLRSNEVGVIRGRLPTGVNKLTLVLENDRFTTDNFLPIIRPQPRRLLLFSPPDSISTLFSNRLLNTVNNLSRSEDPNKADVILTPLSAAPNPPSFGKAKQAAILFHHSAQKFQLRSQTPVLAVPHRLTAHLQWNNLLAVPQQLNLADSDEVLLWQGSLPLIVLREGGRILLLNFDLTASNALRHPALVILLTRFLAAQTEKALGDQATNLEGGQRVQLPANEEATYAANFVAATDGSSSQLRLSRETLTIPSEPGFLEISSSREETLKAGVSLNDPRESDFQQCKSLDVPPARGAYTPRHSKQLAEPPFIEWVLTIIVLLLLSNWLASIKRPSYKFRGKRHAVG